MDKTVAKGIPSLPRTRRKSMTVSDRPLVAQHNNFSSNRRSSSSIDLLLSIPDPPTPDERSTAKTAAVALSLRGRRKSGNFPLAHTKPLFDVTNQLDNTSKESAIDEDHDLTERQSFNVNDSNMDLVEDADSTVLEDRETSTMDETNEHRDHNEGNGAMDVGDDIEFDEDTGICFLDDGDDEDAIDIDIQESSKEVNIGNEDDEEEFGVDLSYSRKRPRQSIMIPDMDAFKSSVFLEADTLDRESPVQNDIRDDIAMNAQTLKRTKSVHENDEVDEKENVVHKKEDFIQHAKMSKKESKSVETDEIRAAIRRYCKLPLNERLRSDDAVFVEQQTGYPLLTTMDHYRRMNVGNSFSEEQWSSVIDTIKREVINGLRQMCGIIEEKKKNESKMLEEFTGCRSVRRKGKYRYESISTGLKVKASDYEIKYLEMLQGQKREKTKELSASNGDDAINAENIKIEDGVQNSTGFDNRISGLDEQNRCSDVMHSIPDRDDLSSDPEIAEAQRKLYAAFDKALREYSDAIFAIRRRKGESVVPSVI